MTTSNDHGTGCSLSAAITAHLARGAAVPDAIRRGQGLRGPGSGRRRRLAAGRRGTDPSTISGGPRRRRLGADMTLHDADTGLRPGQPIPPEPLRPPTPGGISMRPAMIVLGLAVLILVAFVAIGILSSHSPAPVTSELGSVRRPCPG